MNNRIESIAVETLSFLRHNVLSRSDMEDIRIPDAFVEKFAELIVKECADICMEMSAKCAGLPGDGALAKDCAYWIKEDFGIE